MKHLKQNIKQIKLYGYQQIAFDKLVNALKKTFRALIVMATGLGKTIVSIEVVKYFLTPKDRVLFLCHDNGILNKAFTEYQRHVGDSYTYAKFYGEDKDWEADKHHFVFATFQSVLNHLRNEKAVQKLFSPNHFTFIVVDESHHSQAETFAEVINYFKPKYKLGMTATPEREDKEDIRDIFGDEVVEILLPEAIAKGWLTPIDYKLLSDGLDEEKIREVCKAVLVDNVRLTEKQINEKIFIKVRTEEQCKIIKDYSQTRKAIIFCESIQHLEHIASVLPGAVGIHSGQSSQVNDTNYELFESGLVQQVLVVDKFNEGIDIPETELLGFLRGTTSERIFLQQLGRGLRKVPGKEKVVILDFVGNIDRMRQVSKLAKDIERIVGIERGRNGEQKLDTPLHIEGKGFSFDFSNQVVNLLAVFEKLNEDFYSTWQEASQAAIKLGITNQREYWQKYSEDSKLPSHVKYLYKDFPGWDIFFDKEKSLYKTWQEASVAAIKLGITRANQYMFRKTGKGESIGGRYKENPRLPGAPHKYYKDFPGWEAFLGKSDVIIIKTKKDISEITRKKDYYRTWKEASTAAIALGIKGGQSDYRNKYKQDPRLSVEPRNVYEDFPGWLKFLGKE